MSYDDSLETIYDSSKSSKILERCRAATATYGYQQLAREQSNYFCNGCSQKSICVGPVN